MVEILHDENYSIKITPENQHAVNFVGTRAKSGRTQLEVLIKEGLQPHDSIFEVGCGALVAGIAIIRYLDKNKYCGNDPNTWLRDDTLKIEQNRDILEKNPVFYSNDDFKIKNWRKYDFIFAHSIFNHAANWQFEVFLDDVKKHMKKDTKIIISLLFAEGNKHGNPGYGTWPDAIAPLHTDKWMAQDVIYDKAGVPRGDKNGKVNFKTKKFVFDICEKRKLKCEVLDDHASFYKKHSGTNECKDWIRITKE